MLRASRLAPPSLPIVGVNTDPLRSFGKLCSVEIPPGADGLAAASELASRLRSGAREA